MMASYDWRVRHAGLMAIAAIGEGTGKVNWSHSYSARFALTMDAQVMQKELGKIVE